MRTSYVSWNAAGLVLPLFVALACIPRLLTTLGAERFGSLSLALGLTAVAGLFDLGIGRAATRIAAGHVSLGDHAQLRPLARTAVRLAWSSGAVGTVALVAATWAGATGALKFDPAMGDEVRRATYLLALAVPFQAVIAVYRGIGEAQQRFRAIRRA